MKSRKINKFFLFLLSAAAVLSIGRGELFAHCDTLDGPVIQDARTALEKGDVTPALKWVKKDAEPQIRAVFDKTIAERKSNKDAADMKFFETLVRIHRAGEGASFTGLKPGGSVETIVAGADKALETGSLDALTQEMATHLTSGVKKRFERAFALRKHKDESVEAGREYVEAYVEYVHYVEGLHDMIGGKGSHNHEE
ncbi:MAG TPA: DUF6448 family protein [Candidatus Omnitrophota bacterium]|nr:DUF6448 family protein [Candidatus Omnitrophota bacterium]HRZ14721.1 DUF6448 family protein [Candidatus Omnitrophota bacterium]